MGRFGVGKMGGFFFVLVNMKVMLEVFLSKLGFKYLLLLLFLFLFRLFELFGLLVVFWRLLVNLKLELEMEVSFFVVVLFIERDLDGGVIFIVECLFGSLIWIVLDLDKVIVEDFLLDFLLVLCCLNFFFNGILLWM